MLRLASAELSSRLGGVCLDGSLPGYWYSPPAHSAASPSSNRSWLIFLDGGAWCYDEQDCVSRSKGFKGSSAHFPAHYWPYSGPLDSNPRRNPTFAAFHRVLIGYCDGSSYSSERVEPYRARGGELLYFRGRAVLHTLLLELLNAGLSSAENVLFSGGSAGGIGTIFASNWLQSKLPQVTTFKVLLVSSFFLHLKGEIYSSDAPTCTQGRGARSKCLPWAVKMRSMCELHNCTPTLRYADRGCEQAHERKHSLSSAAALWPCFFPSRSLLSVRAPTFVVNSAIDSWQACHLECPTTTLGADDLLAFGSWLTCGGDIIAAGMMV